MRLNAKTLRAFKTSLLMRILNSCLNGLSCADSERRRACEIALPLVVVELKSRGMKI